MVNSRVRIIIVLAILFLLAGIGAAAWFFMAYGKPKEVYKAPPTSVASVAPNAISIGRDPDAPLKANGYAIHIFADKQGAARDLAFTPGGVLLVSDPAAGTITALPDANKDGAADAAKIVLKAGDNPHGIAFYGGKMFVAHTQSVIRYKWDEGTLTATLDRELFKLPKNTEHNLRSLIFDGVGNLYVSVGSTCNVCTEADSRSGSIMLSDANGIDPHVFASGLRNAPFLALHPTSNELWATEMGRDHLGDNIPPDEINIIRENRNYGWPICYGQRVHDANFDNRTYAADPCRLTAPPISQVPAHNAPLGLTFIKSSQFAADQQGDLLVAYHGSWNRSTPDGYKVVRLSIRNSIVTGSEDFLTGFLDRREVLGRPVDLIFDPAGNLYLSDDKAGAIYIIQKQ